MNKKDRDELLLILKDQVEFYKNQVQVLREEKEVLQKQIFNLQDGLMAIRAPMAYMDQQRDKVPLDPINTEELEKQRIYAHLLPRHLKAIESPIFDNVDDMINALGGVLSEAGIKSESLHENAES